MTVLKPTVQPPRWATNPPVAPPTTIVEPTEPEKDAGFQPGSQAQVDDFVISNVLNSHSYTAQINGVLATYVSDGTATIGEITAGLAAAITALGQPVTAVATVNAARVTANVAGQAFISATTDSANVSIVSVTPNRSSKPIRQYVNWFFNVAYQWLIFWFYTIIVPSDFDVTGMDVVPRGAAPSTSGTLVGASGTAISFVAEPAGPTRRAVGINEAHTYTASKDTYVDLNYDGSWSYSQVANGAGAPALSVNARRQWKVVTDGTSITSVVDLRTDLTRFSTRGVSWGIGGNVGGGRAGVNVAPTKLTSPSGDVQTAPFAAAQEGGKYSEVFLGVANVAFGDGRLYMNSFGGFTLAFGCYWKESTSRWLFDAAALASNPSHAAIYQLDPFGTLISYTKTVIGANSATDWVDTLVGWDDISTGVFGRLVNIGGGLLDTGTHMRLARFGLSEDFTNADHILVAQTVSAGAETVRIYRTKSTILIGTDSEGAGTQIAFNARWDGTQWVQDALADSFLIEQSRGGVTYMYFGATGGAPQNIPNAQGGGPTQWVESASIRQGGVTFRGPQTTIDHPNFPNPVTLPETTADRLHLATLSGTADNATLFKANLVKARGHQVADGAGGFSAQETWGCTALMNGANQIDVVFSTPLPSANYAVVFGMGAPTSAAANGQPQVYGPQLTTGFSIRLENVTVPTTYLANFAANWVINFVVV